jgi:hypothetical protein
MEEGRTKPEGETFLEMLFVEVNKPAHVLADKAVIQRGWEGLAGCEQ